MTVQQLAAYLATLPQDAKVVLAGPDGDATPVVEAYVDRLEATGEPVAALLLGREGAGYLCGED